ncbi:hypothetical protein H7J89_07240 [Mycobacterium paraffinicum]|uniref:Uncharacterized protein n=2 Tax=Mycobacterium paraffinicum TaxID=53378 RepID=A0ABP8RMV3_9MYCO|nr:hypothetical protein [Mycobacterium paraffinicum]MCV7310421.1 hypothetical protein [Mycobacterium paraffinicum]
MTPTTEGSPSMTDADVDEIAFEFLRSPYAGDSYLDWSLDQRLDGYLRHCGLPRLVDDGDAYGLILNRVMAYIGELRRRS